MFSKRHLLSIALLATMLLGCAAPSDQTEPVSMQSSINNFSQAEKARWVAGQPSETELRDLAAIGFTTVINLRPRSEWPFDEAGLSHELGLEYHHIPVDGASGITLENARQLHQLLASIGDERTLVHCASGNRVGALIALAQATQNGQDLDMAIEIGRRWGLTGLKSVVVDQIQNLQER